VANISCCATHLQKEAHKTACHTCCCKPGSRSCAAARCVQLYSTRQACVTRAADCSVAAGDTRALVKIRPKTQLKALPANGLFRHTGPCVLSCRGSCNGMVQALSAILNLLAQAHTREMQPPNNHSSDSGAARRHHSTAQHTAVCLQGRCWLPCTHTHTHACAGMPNHKRGLARHSTQRPTQHALSGLCRTALFDGLCAACLHSNSRTDAQPLKPRPVASPTHTPAAVKSCPEGCYKCTQSVHSSTSGGQNNQDRRQSSSELLLLSPEN
jgi:hypothetical protein